MKKPNLVMMFGEDTLSLKEEIHRWIKAFSQKYGDINLEILDGLNCSVSDLQSLIMSSPFLGEKRLIILKNFQKQNSTEKRKALKNILNQIPDSSILVLYEQGQVDKRSTLYKFLVQNATIKNFSKPEGTALIQWIIKRAAKHGISINANLATKLSILLCGDLWQLENEIQKLSLYAANKPVTKEMIEELISRSYKENIFEMTDKLAQKNKTEALRLFKMLHLQGYKAPHLFAMILRQFRLIMEMKDLNKKGLKAKEIASHMKIHPFVVSKTLKSCYNFSEQELHSILQKLLTIDKRLKKGKIHFRPHEEDQYLLAIEKILLQLN